MFSERSSRLTLLNLIGCWERRIGFRLHVSFRAFDPVKEITRRLFPNDHLKAPACYRFGRVTLYRSLVLAVHAHFGLRLPTRGV